MVLHRSARFFPTAVRYHLAQNGSAGHTKTKIEAAASNLVRDNLRRISTAGIYTALWTFLKSQSDV
jgi:hypothetical protein